MNKFNELPEDVVLRCECKSPTHILTCDYIVINEKTGQFVFEMLFDHELTFFWRLRMAFRLLRNNPVSYADVVVSKENARHLGLFLVQKSRD